MHFVSDQVAYPIFALVDSPNGVVQGTAGVGRYVTSIHLSGGVTARGHHGRLCVRGQTTWYALVSCMGI